MSIEKPIVVANFMDASLHDLETKGVFKSIGDTYNPGNQYCRVLHFSPHVKDMEYSERLTQSNIEIHTHPVSGFSPLKILRTIYRCCRIFKREKVDIVRGRLPYLGSLIGCLAAKITGCPSVVSLGGDNRIVQERNEVYAFNNKWLSYTIESLVLRLASAIIVPNKYTEEYVNSICGDITARKCTVIPWISDPIEKSREASSQKEVENTSLILIVGFLNRYKYTDVLFDMLDTLSPLRDGDGRAVTFIFCGDGPLREEGELRFSGRDDVEFYGWTAREKIHELMQKASIVLIPMSGFVLLEAASIGRPVITSSVEWHSEIVKHGETGMVVDPTKPDAWLQGIQAMLSDPETSENMGQALEDLYWREYSPKQATKLELALYEKLISGKAL